MQHIHHPGSASALGNRSPLIRRFTAATLSLALLLTSLEAAAALRFQTIINPGTLATTNNSRHVTSDSRGHVAVVFHSPSGIQLAVSTDEGQNFNSFKLISPDNYDAEIATGPQGEGYIAWVNTATGKIELSKNSDIATVLWSTPTAIGATTSNAVHIAAYYKWVYVLERAANTLLVSSDYGSTFTSVAINANAINSDVHVVPDTGRVVIETDDGANVTYYESPDHGKTFGTAMTSSPAVTIGAGSASTALGIAGKDYLYVAGAGTQAQLTDVMSQSNTSISAGNNTSTTWRGLAGDRCGNIIDGYDTAAGAIVAVSVNGGYIFSAKPAVAGAQYGSVAINGLTGDVLFLYETGAGNVTLDAYSNELGPCYRPRTSPTLVVGGTLVGASNTKQIAITNIWGADMPISISTTGFGFSQTNDCGTALAAGAQCTAIVTFSATSSGYHYGQLKITTNGAPRVVHIHTEAQTPPNGSGTTGTGGTTLDTTGGTSSSTTTTTTTTSASDNTGSSTAYADPQLTSGNNTFGGGAFGGFALGALALVALRRRSAALAGAAMIATAGVACAEDAADNNGAATAAPVVTEAAAPATNVESAPAQTAVAAKESRWYVGANIGTAVTDAKSSDVTAAMNNSGITGTASVSHASRNGWKLFGGYHFNDLLAAEFGYTNLGQITTRYSGTNGLTLSQLIDISPASGKGIEIAAVAKMPINERYTALARVGVWHWQAEYRLNSGSGSVARPSGENGIGGFAIDAAIKDGWNARVAWDIYTILGTTTHLYSVGVTKALNF